MIRQFIIILVLVCGGLSRVSSLAQAQNTTDLPSAMDTASAQVDTPLAGTAWQLVEIASMDNHVEIPVDRSLYTVKFNTDGSIQVRADCNRGTGSWASASPGQLQIGQLAATQALCSPGSLHDRYMTQFAWVRSYVIADGHLFLATQADSSIIEFEPAD